jgi:Ankyrin repeats (many copies)
MHDPNTRALVFGFVGAGQGAFINTVSHACRDPYQGVTPHKTFVARWGTYTDNEIIECTHTKTLLSAALASPARMRLALQESWGLRVRKHDDEPLRSFLVDWTMIGRFADYNTLLAAQAEIANFHLDSWTLAGAAASGDVQKMIRLRTEMGCELGNGAADALTWAARGGSVEAMRWLRQQGREYVTSICTDAAYYGHLNVLRFLHEDGYSAAELRLRVTVPDPNRFRGSDLTGPCEFAARRGHVEVLKWLHEHDWPCDDNICEHAALGVSVPVLAYLSEQGLVFDELAMATAASDLAACQYLHSVGCPWDAEACTTAAGEGSLAVLRWLHENGCPWDTEDVNLAAAGRQDGSVEMIEYLWAEGAVPDRAVLTRMLCKACARDDFTTAQWLREHGAQWPAAITTGMHTTWCTALHLCVHTSLMRTHCSTCCAYLSAPVQVVVLLLCLSASERGNYTASSM